MKANLVKKDNNKKKKGRAVLVDKKKPVMKESPKRIKYTA